MRLLFIDFTLPYLLKDNEYPVGGWAVELSTWIAGLCAAGGQVGVLTWKGARDYVGKHLDFDLLDTYTPGEGIRYLKYLYLIIPSMLRAARAFQPDAIIQACCGLDTGIMAYIARRLEVPFVYRVANDMDVDQRHKAKLKPYERLAFDYGLRRTSAVLCQNQYQYDCLHNRFPDKRIHKLHNPFAFADKYAAAPLVAHSRRKYIAWLGLFSQQKNLPLLLQITKSLPDIPFKIAGMASKTIDPLTQSTLDALKKQANVELMGYLNRSEVPHFLANAKALLSTSHYEGFSNTFLESFAVGTPVVAPRRIDPDLIITQNELGFTAGQDDEITPLVDRIHRMGDEKHSALAKRCQSYVIEKHDPLAKAQALNRILNTVI